MATLRSQIQKKYNDSPKGRAVRAKYQRTTKGKAAAKRCKTKDEQKARTAEMHRLRNYGITQPEFESLFIEQKCACAICDKPLVIAVNTSVDHCHRTGKVRGLLCQTCNRGLGLFKEDPQILRGAIRYLRRHSVMT